ncbi:glycoside hydrolase family 6 protein [Flagelloscypha sp. PMI_526]|nr:glycoside hydrolase family 6 protein [Flagelloscypha sp. PMI_526]
MKSLTFLFIVSFASVAYATLFPDRFARPAKRAACSTPVQLSGSENPFATRTLFANNHYGDYVRTAAQNMTDKSLAEAALRIAKVGTFLWLDTIYSVGTLQGYIDGIGCNEIFGIVIHNLPGKSCGATTSPGELTPGQISVYKQSYIDPIVKIIKANPNVAFAAIIEPDSLVNLVTNNNLPNCINNAAGYREGVQYALSSLNLPNVVTYLDAGHGGVLGWDANIVPGATELARAYKNAGSPANFRGISTNVAGWNAWIKVPGEFENTSDGIYDKCQDEQRYVTIFGAALASAGMPNHAIIDTSRNAVQGLRLAWGDWCNINGAGFGMRPTSNTGESLADAFVWVKPGGESDGTSDTSAVRFDPICGLADAYKPSPELGVWNQGYFEMLLKNANPKF